MAFLKCRYGVRVGRNPGVYDDLEDAQDQVLQYSNADYKGFGTRDDAYRYVYGDSSSGYSEEMGEVEVVRAWHARIIDLMMRKVGSPSGADRYIKFSLGLHGSILRSDRASTHHTRA